MWRRISKREYYRICRMEKMVCKSRLMRRMAWVIFALAIFFAVSFNNCKREYEELEDYVENRRFNELFLLDWWTTNDPVEEVMAKWESSAYGEAMRKDYDRLKKELERKYIVVYISGVIAAAVSYGIYRHAVYWDGRRFLELILFARDGVCVGRNEGRKQSALVKMDVNDGKTITDIQVSAPISGWIACGDSLMMVSGWTEEELAGLDGIVSGKAEPGEDIDLEWMDSSDTDLEKEFRVYPVRMKRVKGHMNQWGHK